MSLEKTYSDTLEKLASLVWVKVPVAARPDDLKFENSMKSMNNYIQRLDIGISDMKFVHVAGTKGKGSTCTFVESICRRKGLKTGLFMSPHLVDVRESLQIDGEMVSKEDFTQLFWYVYNGLDSTRSEEFPNIPSYFCVLVLMGVKYFSDKKVDVSIIEVGMGGLYDATNFINPRVCAITHIEMDHVGPLGGSLESIAAHKAGIIKKGVPVVTYAQKYEGVLSIFEQKAKENDSPIFLSPQNDDIFRCGRMKLKMMGKHQLRNARLAMDICDMFEKTSRDKHFFGKFKGITKYVLGSAFVDDSLSQGLAEANLEGRCQVLNFSKNLTFYLDGAHTVDAMLCSKDWFLDLYNRKKEEERQKKKKRYIFVFNYSGKRSARDLLKPFSEISEVFEKVVLLPMDFAIENRGILPKKKDPSDLEKEKTKLKKIAKVWRELLEGKQITFEFLDSIDLFLDGLLSNDEQKMKTFVLVSGSLYLVGDFLKKLRRMK